LLQKHILLVSVILLVRVHIQAQTPSTNNQVINSLPADSSKPAPVTEKDMGDVIQHWFKPGKALLPDDSRDTRKHYSLLPAVGYTLQTGFAGIVSGNMAWNTDTSSSSKISSVNANITYSEYHQTMVPVQVNIWTKNNRFNIITDFRYINYPSSIYGLGGDTDPNTEYTINFKGIKFHQTVMTSLSGNFYLGLGYYFDKLWKIRARDSLADILNHQLTNMLGKEETASGVALRFLYDSRLNQINPQQGLYVSVTYRNNPTWLGSDSNWQSVLIDSRAYFHFPKKSSNVLAFWALGWLTASGTPPYLLMPSTGWDDNYNTGRGYIQSRFRGYNMHYFETEYRFGLSRNGLFGAVVFANVQHFSNEISSAYDQLIPGYGVGLRLKLNKHSGANLCVDYGFGKNGSRGFFVNLGEIF
jgi:outer membrane protein assembly factor BamA